MFSTLVKLIEKSFLILGLSTILFSPAYSSQPTVIAKIDHQKFTLDNGLRVIVHEDHKAPVVSVHVWYHVGSKDEQSGKTGFAHLFEHIMLSGSENYNHGYFDTVDKLGATSANGTTFMDRTQYFQNVPTGALDTTLWLESDRMGHLLGAIDQDKFDKLRGVVQNEKRQGDNKPYGKANTEILKSIYPTGHPYSWSTIGSMEDLSAATIEDVKHWFTSYYGASNAILVLSGDIDLATAKEKAQLYFGDISPGSPLVKKKANVAKREQSSSKVMFDRVSQTRLYKVWNVAELGHKDASYLALAANILGKGNNSRLYQRLVVKDKLATNAYVSLWKSELSSMFRLVVDLSDDAKVSQVQAAINEELTLFINKGATKKELTLAKAIKSASFLRQLERIGGKTGKAAILAKGELLLDNTNAIIEAENVYQQASVQAVKHASEYWLSAGDFNLEVRPFGQYSVAKKGADRSKLPTLKATPALEFPQLQRTTLKNGLKVILAERHSTPLVQMLMQFDAGIAADQHHQPGTSSFALAMLSKGSQKYNVRQIDENNALLGAKLSNWVTLDSSIFKLDALKKNAPESASLFANLILQPNFSQSDINQLKTKWYSTIKREKNSSYDMALRTLPPILYGSDHPYGVPLTGTGNAKAIKRLNKQMLNTFYQHWIRPDNATLIVTGDMTMAELTPILEKNFSQWKVPKVAKLKKSIPNVALTNKPKVYLIDKPQAGQSIILAGQIMPSALDKNAQIFNVANTILGSAYIARINMNLREDKGWSYGAYTRMKEAKGQQPFFAYAPVQANKTKESIVALKKELSQFVNNKPASSKELKEVQIMQGNALPGKYETNARVVSEIATMQTFNRPDTFIEDYKKMLDGLQLTEIQKVSNEYLKPEQLIWVVIGDLATIEKGIRELNIGEVIILDHL